MERVQHEEWVSPTWERVGDLVYAERRRQHMTQAELARRAGVSRAWLIDVERGHASAAPQRVIRVLDQLGLELLVRRRHGSLTFAYTKGADPRAPLTPGLPVSDRVYGEAAVAPPERRAAQAHMTQQIERQVHPRPRCRPVKADTEWAGPGSVR